MILLFLGLELASLPVYVMVSISRPIPAAQEAGVKYFFLVAMSAAVMLFGFSYLYGATGTTDLFEIAHHFRNTFGASVTGPSHFTAWEMLAAVMLIGGFAFKLAAVPFHFYAGDVYTGAATPVTAFLSFVPKTSGLVALVKLMFVLGGGGVFAVPVEIGQLLWVMAVLTMTVGNVLGLVQQQNIKRVLAYSSIAHSGYLLAAVATMVNTGGNPGLGERALTAVLFYLTAYGITNVGTFAVLVLLPSRSDAPATSAETFDDLAGAGRRHPGLGLAMAISCFSLIGIPMTVGFFGKYLILQPTLQAAQEGSRGMYALAIITVVNAAVSSAYYLRIIAAMFLRTEPHGHVAATGAADTVHAPHPHHPLKLSFPTVLAAVLSSVGTLLFGTVLPATQVLSTRTAQAAQVDDSVNPDLASDDTDSVAPGAAKRPATLPVPPPATAARPTPPTALR
jgi:NADH-quinone oxidoreductase subunit N